MKQFYAMILVALFGSFANAQIINFPDANFKAKLLDLGIDTNGDGEIDTPEAAAVFSLFLPNLNITSLEGIENFTTLHDLDCSNNLLTTLNVSSISSLRQLACNNNNLTSLNAPQTIERISCAHNQLTMLDTAGMILNGLDISYNQILNIDLSNAIGNEAILNLSGNPYPSLNVGGGMVLELICNDTQLIDLNLSGLSTVDQGLTIRNNLNLQHINAPHVYSNYGCQLTQSYLNCYFQYSIANNPALISVCTLDEISAQNLQLYFNNPSLAVSTNCTFNASETYNTVVGNVRFDSNSNGCDPLDDAAKNLQIKMTSGNYNLGSTYTDSDGNFITYQNSNFTITPQLQSNYFTVIPASVTTDFTGNGNSGSADFCIPPNGIHHDLEISLYPITAARPGFDSTYRLTYNNKGNQTENGSVSMTFEDAFLDFVSANPGIATQSVGNLFWTFNNLKPFESRNITITLHANSPLESPALNQGDVLNFTSEVNTTQSEETPNDNSAILLQTLVNSVDPNDKNVAEGTFITPNQVGDYLHYTIRFQNTGAAAAEIVKITDFLSDNLNLATFHIVDASDTYRATMTLNNRLEIVFDNINLPGEPCSYQFDMTNNPALTSVCVDEALDDLSSYLNNPNISFTSYCEFSPANSFYNTVTGTVKYDSNNNGCDVFDPAVALTRIGLSQSDYSFGNVFTNANGGYIAYQSYTAFTYKPEFENPYFTIAPESFTPVFSGYGQTQTGNFCITPNGTHADLEIYLLAEAPIPGFDTNYTLIYKNKGTETQSGTVSFGFNYSVLDFVNANPLTDSQATGNLSWNFSDLKPFESRQIHFVLNVNSQMETPAVNLGDILNFTSEITGLVDETPENNHSDITQIVVGSQDPNGKSVTEGAFISTDQTNDYLHYTVRFQNNGTAAAQNVVVKDLLAANFDLTSLEIIGASHAFRTSLTNTNKLEFFFENINLPDSTTDESGSHGFISFKIKPKNTVGLGSVLQNNASIYFDYSFPIVTNTVTTTVATLGTKVFDNNSFTVYPNPTAAVLNIQMKENRVIDAIEIFSSLGQVILVQKNAKNFVDVSGLASGMYFIKVTSDNGKTIQKFLKL